MGKAQILGPLIILGVLVTLVADILLVIKVVL